MFIDWLRTRVWRFKKEREKRPGTRLLIKHKCLRFTETGLEKFNQKPWVFHFKFSVVNAAPLQSSALKFSFFSVTVLSNPCGNGWRKDGLKCYRYFSTKMSWTGANQSCVKLGGYLMEPRSAVETNLIASRYFSISRARHHHVWIGLNDLGAEGVYQWSTGRALTQNYAPWGENNPDNSGDEDCVHYWDILTKVWNDIKCFRESSYMCERSKYNDGIGTFLYSIDGRKHT